MGPGQLGSVVVHTEGDARREALDALLHRFFGQSTPPVGQGAARRKRSPGPAPVVVGIEIPPKATERTEGADQPTTASLRQPTRPVVANGRSDMVITLYAVTVRNAVGRERVERVVATSDRSASNAALKRVERETGAKDWMVALVIEA